MEPVRTTCVISSVVVKRRLRPASPVALVLIASLAPCLLADSVNPVAARDPPPSAAASVPADSFAALAGGDPPPSLEASFAAPPASALPWAYWMWMDGNLSREGITADLEAMGSAGLATYRGTFDVPEPPRRPERLLLSLGVVKNLARVRLNGCDLGVLRCPPWRVDITEAVVAGRNGLEIDVANLWHRAVHVLHVEALFQGLSPPPVRAPRAGEPRHDGMRLDETVILARLRHALPCPPIFGGRYPGPRCRGLAAPRPARH